MCIRDSLQKARALCQQRLDAVLSHETAAIAWGLPVDSDALARVRITSQSLGHGHHDPDVYAVSYTHLDVYKRQIQDRGASDTRLRSTLIIEDLSDVLTCISARSGANGPNNPVTQYILSQAAEYLAERLIEDAAPGSGGGSVPRTLSGALGHQPFIESVLNMSQHQMLRRWPLATDWYTDVIHYVMRPSRFTRAIDYVRSQFDDLSLIHI